MRRNENALSTRRGQGTDLAPWSQESFLSPSTFFNTSPWRLMRRLQEDMDGLFGQFFGGQGASSGTLAPATQATAALRWVPRMDISETDREWLVEAELPGVQPDNVDVRIQDHHLILRAEMVQEEEEPAEGQPSQGDGGRTQGQQAGQGGGRAQGRQAGQGGEQRRYVVRERRYGFFERILPLPENVDEQNVRCEFRDGVLRVHLPKTEQARQQSQRIPIQARSSQGRNGQTQSREPAMAGAKGGETGGPETNEQNPSGGRTS